MTIQQQQAEILREMAKSKRVMTLSHEGTPQWHEAEADALDAGAAALSRQREQEEQIRIALEDLNLHCTDHAPDPDCEGCRTQLAGVPLAVQPSAALSQPSRQLVEALDCIGNIINDAPFRGEERDGAWQAFLENRKIIESAALVPQGWREMDSAPKDGTLILVFDPSLKSHQVTPAIWDRDEQVEGGECWRDRVFDWDRLTPTHWIPLPAPPLSPDPPQENR